MATDIVSPTFVLTEEMVESFYREGYFYARGLLTQDAVDRLNREHAPFAAGEAGAEWKSHGFTHFDKHAADFPETARFLRDPAFAHLFERVLGGKVRLWLGMYAVVAPQGKGLEWHQDNMYTHILGHMLNGFIALDKITQENAGLWIAPRSHLLGRQPDVSEPGSTHRRAAEPANGMPCEPMEPGDAIIFHRETLHHSKMNHTDRPRRAYAFQVAADSCRFAATGKRLEDRELLSS